MPLPLRSAYAMPQTVPEGRLLFSTYVRPLRLHAERLRAAQGQPHQPRHGRGHLVRPEHRAVAQDPCVGPQRVRVALEVGAHDRRHVEPPEDAGRRHDEAAQWLRKAVQLRSNLAEAHSNLGLVLSRLDQHREAVACFEQAIRLQPNFGHAHRNLAATLQDRLRLREAIAPRSACIRGWGK